MAAAVLRVLGPAARRAVGGVPCWAQPCRAHRLTPADDELYQRTRMTVLEPESPNIVFIEGYTSRGFTISGDLVVGPCAILPRAILQWNVGSYRDISLESLSLFRLLEPQIGVAVGELLVPAGRTGVGRGSLSTALPTLSCGCLLVTEILVLGTGDRVERLHPTVLKQMRECGIAVEVQDTPNACATFNFLTSEKRMAAAGLIPPRGTYMGI
ncbi:NADH dehydrogenase [ubiquinone] 1 alpha subcomplex assembly factor 3 isoform X1 [Phalacrocorax carbo]|uniref:NADH dehydrogenase [ubiquinone] 1 alpha subcomplex assembly factor 3 isoform X1 n=1 Tax=Phalacrocorax carbo TaxID=9209 RepID=UPI0031198866